MNMNEIWIDDRNNIPGYCNQYIIVSLMTPELTQENKKKLEELVLLDTKEPKRFFGSLEGAMYAQVSHMDGYDRLDLDIAKGDFESARRLSQAFPEAVVFTSNDWDEYSVAAFSGGKEYGDVSFKWDGDEPEPYEEDGETYYDCDVVAFISLPFAKTSAQALCGGGMCSDKDFLYYRHNCREAKKTNNCAYLNCCIFFCAQALLSDTQM